MIGVCFHGKLESRILDDSRHLVHFDSDVCWHDNDAVMPNASLQLGQSPASAWRRVVSDKVVFNATHQHGTIFSRFQRKPWFLFVHNGLFSQDGPASSRMSVDSIPLMLLAIMLPSRMVN